MENKSNSLNRIKRQQREKVLRFSIRKYSFGAASVAVAALMFLGAHVVSADVVDAKNQPAIGAPNPKEEESPLLEPAPIAKNEETKETEKVEVAKETEEREKPSENKEAVEANPLTNGTSTSTITVTKDASGDEVTEKQTLDKSQLQDSITNVQELLDKVNKEKAPASTLAAIQADLETANSVLNNNSLELTQAEIDAIAKKLNEKIFVLSSMPKVDAPKKVLKEGKNTIANTGSHDSRNGQRMGKGVSFRANDVRVEGSLYNVKEYISEEKFSNRGTTIGDRARTIGKTFMTAKYSVEQGHKFITYDVYFQNDGHALDGNTKNAFWFYPPRDLLPNVGRNYPIGVVSDAYYERYKKKAGATGTLSENPSNFTQVGERYTVSLRAGKGEDSSSERLWGNAGGLFQFGGGPNRDDQRQQMLKQLQHNRDLNGIIKSNNNPDGPYPTLSYSHLLTVGSHQNFAYKYHVKMRLRDDVTDTQAQRAGTMAVTAKSGFATTALQAYVYAATGTSLLAAPSINTLTKYNGTLVSTDRVISGTGVAGAKITLTMQDGTPRTIHVDNSGRWSYTLKQNEKLTQNTRQDASIKSPNTISAKQTKNGEESSATSVNVQLARAISIDTPLQAGRDISVKVAHDTGRFYIQVRNAANTATVYEYGVIQENGSWRIENSAAANAIDVKVTDGDTPSEKKITLHVNDSHRKNNIPFKITKDHVVRVRSHHVHYANIAADPGHENDGWVTAAKATNTNPTIAIKDSNATYTSDGTLTKDKLKTLVTVNDAEDTPGKTVGNTAAENLDVKATKDGKNVDLTKPLKQGTYNLTYSTTDAAGAIATKNHTITVNYAAVAKSKINLVQEESVSDELKRSLLELRDGNDKVAIPNNARVEVTLDTSAKADSKTAVASVVLQGKTIASTNITYRVLPTFPIAHTVYDFKGVNRSDDESKYYLNTGIPRGMKWFAKRGNEAEIDASGLRDKINADPVGETTYKFGGKYNYGRFTDSPQPNEKLEHAATFTHKVFDIKPNDTKVTVAQGGTLSEAQAISAVAKVTGSPDLPSGTTYEWVDDRGNKITPTANTAGVQNFKVKVTLPPAQSGNDAPEATRRQPSKIIAVPVNITPPAPTVTPTINNMVTSTDRVLRGKGLAGAKVKVTVNTTPLPEVTVGRDGNWAVTLPKGLNSNHAPSQAQLVNKDPLKVTQSVDGVDSPITNVTVAVGETKVQPTVENGTSVYAGAKMITVKAPHDAGIFYVKYREKDSNQEKEIGIKRDSISGPWTSIAPERGVVTVSVNKDRFTDTVTIEMKESIKEGSISAVANIRQGGYSSPYSWKATPVTNDAPTLTSTFTGPKKVVEYGSAFNPTELVRASDKEDDTGLTRGTGRVEVVSVNGNTGNKTVNTSQTGTYTVRLKATDSQGKVSAEKDVTIEVTKNHQAVAKPVVNLKVGETLTPAEKRSLIELQEGNGRVALPDDAIVEVNLDTSAKSNSKQTKANVRFKDGTVKNVNLNYKVLQTFPVATKVYDFNGVARNQNEDAYYSNTGLPDGFNWFVRQNGTAKPDGYIQNYLRDDSVGTTDYVYGAKYREGRFTNNAPESDRLEHSGTVSHTVFDVGANTTRVMVKSGTSLADSQAKDAVMAVNGSEPLPKGTTYEWVNQDGTPLANKQVTEKGEAVRYVKVTLPKTAEDGPVATQYRSSKIVRVIINESEKPRVSFNGSELSTDASNENSKFVIFRGATFDPTFTVSDNSGKVTEIKASGLPSGREFVKNTDTPNGNVQITGNDITATSNATLGDHIGKVLVKDALGNEQEYQFKYTVVDIKIVENPKTVPINTKLGDSHFHVRLVNSDATDATSQEGLYPTNTKFKWKKENNGVSNETVLSEPGKITGYKAVVESPAARAGFYTKNGVKIYMPASIERDITFLVKPNDIIRYSKNGDDVDKTTTTHTVDPNTGKITPTPNTVTHQKDGAKDTVVTQTIPVTTRYEPDETKDVGINTVVNNGSEGSIVTTTPKLVNEITGEVTNGTPVVRKTEMVPKVVKVGTKPKVVETPLEKPVRYVADPTQPKGEKTTETEGEDGKVVTTTHYTVNPDGSVTEGETTSVRIEPKEKVVKVGTKEAKLTPTVELDQDPDTGEVTVTPKKPDGTLYPENTKVEIPGKDKDHPITVTLGKDGKGKVPNNDLPDGEITGTGKITPPGKPSVELEVKTPKKLDPNASQTEQPGGIEITRKPNGDAVVTPKKPDGTTYPSGTKVVIPGDHNTPIEVIIGEDGSGTVPNDSLPKGDIKGKGTVTEPDKRPSNPVDVTTPAKLIPTVELNQDPSTGDVTVTPKKPDGTLYPENTKVEIPGKDKDHPITITIGKDGTGKVPNNELPEGKVPGTSKITVPGKPSVEVPNVTTPSKLIPTVELQQDPDTGEVTVTPKKPDGTLYPENTKVEIPGKDKEHPITITIGKDGKGKVPNSELPEGKVPGTGKITVPGKPAVEVPNVTTPSKVTPTVELDQDPDTGEVTVTPKKPDGTLYPENTKVEIPGKDKDHPITITIGKDGTGKVPNSELPEGKVPGTSKITVPGKPAVEVPNVTTPSKVTPTVELDQDPDTGEVTVTPKKPDGTLYPENTKVEIPGKDKDHPITITIGKDGTGKVPNSELPEGKVPGTSKITVPGKPAVEVPNVTTPSKVTPTVELDQDPDTGEVTVTPKKPDGTLYPENTKVEIPGKDKDHPITVTLGKDGKGKVPNNDLPDGEITGTGKITPPGKPSVELEVKTPKKLDPNASQTEQPGGIEITRKPNGDAVVTPKKPDGTTYPSGTKVVIPGDHNTPIEVIIGEDGSGTVPNDSLPKGDIKGKGTVTEPDKRPSNPVDVTTPAKLIPTVELNQDPSTGDVTVTPKKPDGTLYPENTKVEIPGKDKDHPITITIGKDGTGKVPNNELPEGKVPGTSKITVPGKPSVEVPNVTTPSKLIPTVELQQDPDTGEVTVTPKKPDGTLYPENTKVEIPGKDKEHPITITIGKDGKGKVPNSELPEGKVPGTGKITVPGKPAVEVPNVTTPSKVTPTVELDQDPDTGEVTVTPKKPDGTLYPENTKVEIPGKDKDHPITITIGKDGTGKVPNSELPEGKVPGTSKITVPGKPAVEVPNVTTPSKVTPTVELDQDPDTGEVTVTPKKPDGTLYPENTKVEIPGKDKDHPITITIGKDGTGKVPNSELPEGKVPGTSKITVPGKPAVEVPNVTTPSKVTPTVELDQDPDTGEVTVTPKKPDGTLYPENTKVEIPGKDKDHPITVTLGKDGKGKVPNNDLPDGEITGTGKITPPGKPSVELEVKTPKKLDPNASQTEQPGGIEITRKPNGDAVVTPKKPDGTTYPSGTKVVIPGDHNTPIEVIIGEDGSGTVPNDSLPKGDIKGKGTVTEPDKRPSNPVDVTTPAKLIPTVELNQDPSTGDVTVTPKKPDGTLYPENTKVEIPGKDKDHPITITIGKDGTGKVPNNELPEGKVPGTSKITVPGKPSVEVPNVTTPSKLIPTVELQQDPDTGEVTVTPKKPDGTLYPENTKVEIPGKDKEHPITITIGKDGKGKVPNSELPEGKVPGTGKITVPGKPAVEVPNVTTPSKVTPTVELDQDPDTGEVTVTPKKPDGTLYPENTKVEIPGKDKDHPITITIGKDGTGKVPNSELPEGKVPGTSKITVPGKPAVEVPNVTTPSKVTPTVELDQDPDTGEVTVTPKKPDGTLYPENTKVEIPGKDKDHPITITIGKDGTGKVPNSELPEGKVPGTSKITVPGKPAVEVPNVTTPSKVTPTVELDQDPDTGEVTVTPKKPDGTLYPENTKVEIPGKDKDHPITVTLGKDGKGKVPNNDLPDGEITGTGKITPPGKPSVELEVKTPKKLDPNASQTEQPGGIEITRKPNGDAVVTPKKPDGTTYPSGTKVVIPGDHNTPIEVIIGEDGSGTVPNDSLPKGDIKGKGTVTEPDKRPSNPVDVTTPAKLIPTVELNQDPSTGDVTVTPKKPDGTLYPENTKVEIPGKDKDHPITITIGKDGTGKVPNNELPEGKVPGTSKITVPGKPSVEVPNVTTPSKLIPTVELQQDPDTGEVTVTPKKPDGTLYPENTKVEIPGKDKEHPITITIGKDGKGKVPNSELPEGKVPGTGKITVPGKPAVEVPNVTTPSKVTPTVELDQDPDTGEVTVTPKKPDGTLYPENTKVEIPGKDKDHPITITIGKDGTGKVPNSELPEGKVPGTSKITVPGKPAVEVPNVTTPSKVTPTVELDQDPDTGEVTVTPKKPDGTLYPENTKVEIPGKDKDHPITITIGKDGTGKVPNSELPEGKVPGTSKITVPGKPAVEVPNVTTPSKVTPTVELDQDPDTGEVTVTPKKPDGTLYPENTKVEIPGKDKDHPITVTLGKDGKGKVPNNDLPDGEITGTGKITPPGKPSVELEVKTPKKLDPNASQTEQPGGIEITRKPNGDAVVTPKKPDGTTYPSGTKVVIPGDHNTPIEVIIGEDGSGTVPNDSLPKGDIKGKGTVTEPDKRPSNPVDVTTPAKLIPTVELNQDPSTGDVTVTPKKPDGTLYPENTKVEIPGKDKDHPITITIGKDGTGKVPNNELPEGKVPGTSKITVPGKPSVEVPNVTTPSKLIPTVELQQDPDTGEVTVTPKKPDGTLYPENTKVEIPGKDKEHPITITIGKDGKGKVPNSELPEGKVPGTGKITVPGKPAVEVPNVTTPSKVTPTVELDQDPDTGEVTVTPKKPDGTLYPENTKVEIPGKDKDHPITITIGKDGTGKVPNSELPEGKVPGTSKITVPGKPAVEVPNVTTPSKVTPTVELDQDPDTGEVTVTPKKPDGTLYPENTKVEIPGKDKDHPITVTLGKDGKGKVPNNDLPDGEITGTGKITPPGKPSVELEVKTPKKLDPNASQTEQPGGIEITRKPNGDAVVTPKKPGGGTYPPGTKVEIPGEDGNTITVEIGKDGSGKVPNDKLPKKAVPGTGTVTEPNKKPSQPVNVTTPAHKTPTLDVERDPNTGDVTVTPKRPDGSTYPPGTTVEIPGKDKDHPITVAIGEDGTGKVPNSDLPDVETPGTGKITEPGKPAVEVPVVTTPAKLKTSENGELPDPITLPELTIEVRWIDEDGNVLKPSVKTGEADATAHGSIPGYEFVRTIIDENEPVITHIFRKVSGSTNPNTIPVTPVTPDTNGGSGQDAPAPTTPVPDAVTPNADQVDTKTTVDNGAKSNGSQNVLPNTGTESNATLASLGLLGMLGGLGLALAKKKED